MPRSSRAYLRSAGEPTTHTYTYMYTYILATGACFGEGNNRKHLLQIRAESLGVHLRETDLHDSVEGVLIGVEESQRRLVETRHRADAPTHTTSTKRS